MGFTNSIYRNPCITHVELDGFCVTFPVLCAHERRTPKDPAVVADELKQEFVKAERDRDTAIYELTGRSWRPDESPASFVHDICRLAKLAYLGFGADALDTIARDCFLKGLSPELRVALRRDPQTVTKKVQDLAAEVVRLQLAGVGSTTPQTARVAQATVTDPDASYTTRTDFCASESIN